MKKHLLMLLSWTMLALGAISFASCGDDDDDDNNNSSPKTSIVEKYKGKSGATIDGDNVVYVNGNTIYVYHFSGDKIDKCTAYIDYESNQLAKTAYEEGKKENPDLQIDGSVVYCTVTPEEYEEFNELSKEEFCAVLNGDYSKLLNDLGGLGDIDFNTED